MICMDPGHLVRALFQFLLRFCWSCYWLKFRWSCQWKKLSWSSHRNIFQSWLSHRNIFQSWSSHRNIFLLKKFGSFKLRTFNIVAVRFFLAHFSHRNLLATMPRREPVGAIRQTFNSSSGADDGLEFICYVGGQQTQIQEVWTFGDDGITREVHPFARVDAGAFSGDCF